MPTHPEEVPEPGDDTQGLGQSVAGYVQARRAYQAKLRRQMGANFLARLGGRAPQAVGDIERDVSAWNKSLTDQYNKVLAIQGAIGVSPTDVMKEKMLYMKTILVEAMKSLNKNKDVYSDAQYRLASKQLDGLIAKTNAVDQTLDTAMAARGKAGKAAEGPDITKVNKAITATVNEITEKTGTLRDFIWVRSSHLTRAEQDLFFGKLENIQSATDLPPGSGEEKLKDALETDEIKDIRKGYYDLTYKVEEGEDPKVIAAQLDVAPSLVQSIEQMAFETDPVTGKKKLTEESRTAATREATIKGISDQYDTLIEGFEDTIRGSSGGSFANELQKILQGHGGATNPQELFSVLSFGGTPAEQAQQQSQRDALTAEREGIAGKMVSPLAPQGFEGEAAAFFQDPSFKAGMRKYGFVDPKEFATTLRQQYRKASRVGKAADRFKRIAMSQGKDPDTIEGLTPGLESRQKRVKGRIIEELGGFTGGTS